VARYSGQPDYRVCPRDEKLTRPSFGYLQVELSVDDPQAYTEPWTVTLEQLIQVDTAMLEEICLDDERDVALYQ